MVVWYGRVLPCSSGGIEQGTIEMVNHRVAGGRYIHTATILWSPLTEDCLGNRLGLETRW